MVIAFSYIFRCAADNICSWRFELFSPLLLFQSKASLYVGTAIGFILCVLFYMAFWNYKVEKREKFDRIIKLQIYLYTFGLVVAYFIFKPKYSPQFTMYWCTAAFYIFSVIFSQTLKRSQKKYLDLVAGGKGTPQNVSLSKKEDRQAST
jgi:hypothetical protein